MSVFSLKNFNWGRGAFIIGYQAAFLAGLPFYFYYAPPSLALVVASIVVLLLTSFGIGVYHRHYSHCGYKLSKWIEPFFLFFGTAALEGSVLTWAHDHRKHHRFLDTDKDPYTVSKGFWHAHILWILEKAQPYDFQRYVPDLLKNKLLMFQYRHYIFLTFVTNFLLFLAVGFVTGEYLGAFVLSWWGRIFVLHHLTWFINSLAHYWGERTYTKEQSAVDNYILAFFTVGEGYHNYHHTFPADYRNGIRWYHFDPNKWLVWTLSKLGLARGLLRHNEFTIRQKLLLADQDLFLKTLANKPLTHRQELEQRIHSLSLSLQEKLVRMKLIAEERKAAFKAKRQELSRSLRQTKRSLRREWRQWHKLGRNIFDSQAE